MKLVVSLHDVHPGSLSLVARQRESLRSLGVRRFSLLVVPNWHCHEPVERDDTFVRTVSRWRDEGDEIVLHGWTHLSQGLTEAPRHWFWTRVYTASEAEFLVAGPRECRARLLTGRALLDQLDWPVVGFIAPAWLMAPHTYEVLRDLGFAYTTTRRAVVPLAIGSQSLPSTSLCYSTRSLWRRLCSMVWNPSLARSSRFRGLMRISLHPGDIEHSYIWAQILRLVSRALRAGRASTTYRDYIADSGRVFPAPSAPRQRLPEPTG